MKSQIYPEPDSYEQYYKEADRAFYETKKNNYILHKERDRK